MSRVDRPFVPCSSFDVLDLDIKDALFSLDHSLRIHHISSHYLCLLTTCIYSVSVPVRYHTYSLPVFNDLLDSSLNENHISRWRASCILSSGTRGVSYSSEPSQLRRFGTVRHSKYCSGAQRSGASPISIVPCRSATPNAHWQKLLPQRDVNTLLSAPPPCAIAGLILALSLPHGLARAFRSPVTSPQDPQIYRSQEWFFKLLYFHTGIRKKRLLSAWRRSKVVFFLAASFVLVLTDVFTLNSFPASRLTQLPCPTNSGSCAFRPLLVCTPLPPAVLRARKRNEIATHENA
ncbi:hypothetical protein FB451DRAFT_137336 [Mycena latifolia]|nr:hypothetical protein FB451DRAFT_137336 [Mycena latifolia]